MELITVGSKYNEGKVAFTRCVKNISLAVFRKSAVKKRNDDLN